MKKRLQPRVFPGKPTDNLCVPSHTVLLPRVILNLYFLNSTKADWSSFSIFDRPI